MNHKLIENTTENIIRKNIKNSKTLERIGYKKNMLRNRRQIKRKKELKKHFV